MDSFCTVPAWPALLVRPVRKALQTPQVWQPLFFPHTVSKAGNGKVKGEGCARQSCPGSTADARFPNKLNGGRRKHQRHPVGGQFRFAQPIASRRASPVMISLPGEWFFGAAKGRRERDLRPHPSNLAQHTYFSFLVGKRRASQPPSIISGPPRCVPCPLRHSKPRRAHNPGLLDPCPVNRPA